VPQTYSRPGLDLNQRALLPARAGLEEAAWVTPFPWHLLSLNPGTDSLLGLLKAETSQPETQRRAEEPGGLPPQKQPKDSEGEE
jgi:hypothetical protein